MRQAKIDRIIAGTGTVATKTIDAATASLLARLFPELGTGKEAEFAGAWIAGWAIIFTTEDGRKFPLNMDTEMRYWSEGHSDWSVAPSVPGIINNIMAKPNGPATTQ